MHNEKIILLNQKQEVGCVSIGLLLNFRASVEHVWEKKPWVLLKRVCNLAFSSANVVNLYSLKAAQISESPSKHT